MNLNARHCPICCSTEYKVLFTAQSRGDEFEPPIVSNYVRCKECELIYLTPVPRSQDLAVAYDYLPTRIRHASPMNRILALVEPFLSPLLDRVEYLHTIPHKRGEGCKILDIGCGSGDKLVAFQARGWEVYGLDISSTHIETAKRLLPKGTFFCSELGSADLPSDYFDSVRIDNVLEHLFDPIEVLMVIHRILKPGGKLLIYVPRGNSFTMKYRPTCSVNSWVPFHLSLFTEDTIRMALKKVGFSRVEINTCTPIPWLFGFLQLSLRNSSLAAGMSAVKKIAVTPILAPVSWILSAAKQGEELVVCAEK